MMQMSNYSYNSKIKAELRINDVLVVDACLNSVMLVSMLSLPADVWHILAPVACVLVTSN